MNTESLLLFIPTIASVSLMPGLCMTLAFTLGLSVGYARTLWMMAGELLGLTSVFSATFWGLSWLLNQDPRIFQALSLVGGVYIAFLAIKLFQESPALARAPRHIDSGRWALFSLGYITAIMNPKGWAFMLALLPGFVATDDALLPQYAVMLLTIVVIEFTSMTLYAHGGQWLAKRMSSSAGLVHTNRLAAVVLAGVSVWVIYGALFVSVVR